MRGKIILITGGTGSWGEALIKQLIDEEVAEIRVFARNEGMQFDTATKFNHIKIKSIVGDIRDRKSLLDACRGVDIVFHLAALKHVPICEIQPLEAIKTNVLGTQNVIDTAIMCKVEKVVYVSTDKAVDPSSTYGFTKALGEKIIIQANEKSITTKFSCLRSGNVLGSNGSVIPVFKKQIEQEGIIKITDKRMTRFFIPTEEAIETLIKVTQISRGGEIFIMKMPAIKITDIAEVIGETYGEGEIKIVEIGKRPGEKLSEELLTEGEKEMVYDVDDDFYMIVPNDAYHALIEDKEKNPEVMISHSSIETVAKGKVEEILRKGGFLEK